MSDFDLIGHDDVADLARGAAVLGTGGGGDPYIGRVMAEQAIRRHGPVRVVQLADVPDDALVVPVGMMGAPAVMVEKLPAGHEPARAVAALAEVLGRTPTHVACVEAGGVNSMIPITAAAELGLPLIDGDGMGRAFPELQMMLPTLEGVAATPMALTDEKGNSLVLRTVDNRWGERLARPATVEMGASAATAIYPMDGAQAKRGLVPGTLGVARDLGARLARARREHADPVAEAVAALGGFELLRGKVVDVSRRTTGGFVRGRAGLEGTGEWAGHTLALGFQNEHLVAERDGAVVASTPDLICVLDAETGEPVTTEAMRYGFRVAVLGIPCHPRWRTDEGLDLVGPRYFGYDHDFVPVERLV
ncbi:hypothetical protein SAMN02745673_00035 [Marinactinospora thermotolerans DSM 45154]|uniref:DUF917 domain-containing protein n=1 Tax=Marinactinospora thermotolerans DSM 45154 TaxID=1122192 RepID=A0A1T4JX73_9ACTN|nr:DUF917 domain-containing protein [Marinactinospora thermotolerans]SJZ34761.1 hypothetical protein SAMN02745673_00035 [Marinactinospora thermotolerans DSM 45154]